ncbi:MAG: hypothetical protein ACI9EV_001530 [Urechidicola sp.]|jgi:hypothetical protein
MDTDFTIPQTDIESLVEQHFNVILDRRLSAHQTFLDQIKKLQSKLLSKCTDSTDEIHLIAHIKSYKVDLSKLIKQHLVKKDPLDFQTQFPALESSLASLAQRHKNIEDRIQKVERYQLQPEDDPFLKILKFFKRTGYMISHPGSIFKKDKKYDKWIHHVDARNISLFYWRDHLSQRLITLINPLNRAMNSATVALWKSDSLLSEAIRNRQLVASSENLQEIILKNHALGSDLISEEKESLRKKAKVLISKNWNEYRESIDKAGTIELSNKLFNKEILTKKHRVLNSSVVSLDTNWSNTKEVLKDDWYLELELDSLQLIASVEYNRISNLITHKISDSILPQLDAVIAKFNSLKSLIEETQEESQLEEKLVAILNDLKSNDSHDFFINSSDIILKSELPLIANKLEYNIDNAIKNISKETTVYKETDYQLPIPGSDITLSSIQELIRFDGWPAFIKSSGILKSKLTAGITEVQNEIINQGQVVEFNCQTALELCSEKDEENQPKSVAITSIDRSIESLELQKTKVKALEDAVKSDLLKATEDFNSKVNDLSEDESLLTIKMIVAANKALEKSEKLKLKARETFRNIVPITIQKTKELSDKFLAQVKKLKILFGIQDKPEQMNLNLSDFLIEAEQSHKRFPFIYQRLFRNEALKEKTFFVGRSKEIQTIKTALSRFKNNRFAATILLGEKGSGLTSTINMAIEEIHDQMPAYRILNTESVKTKEDLYAILSNAFDTPITSLEECVDHFNQLPKSMMILENVHLMFLKKLHGFDVIKELSELISLTSNNIYWIVSCYSHCFDFLSRSIDFSSQFRYVINMEEFSNDIMINIIKERHKVSGYSLTFQASTVNKKSKKFNKMTVEDQQLFLENQYFSELNRFAKGNIRLGISYWLSSTREVSGNRLVISSFFQFDQSLLRNLSERNLYTLSSLILHDKLKLQDFSAALNMELDEARRTLQTLQEYGIVQQNGDYFSLNPLLYRQCLQVLKSKNIIH